MSDRLRAAFVLFTIIGGAWPASGQQAEAPLERLTFEEAVSRALERNPSVGQADQAVLRAQALMDQARAVFRPSVDASVATTVLDDARGFSGNITQPRTQTGVSGRVSYALLAAPRWALTRQAADQVGVARISVEETRRQVALLAAQTYLAVLATRHQLEIAVRNRDTAIALADYARARREAGQGSRLNHVRSSQERASAEGLLLSAELAVRQAQEALGVATFSPGPVDAAGEADIPPPTPGEGGEGWLGRRPDVRLFSAQEKAADRVLSDTWKSWLPSATASFSPQYVTPAGFFAPARTWAALFQLEVPIYDGSLGATRRVRRAGLETARLRLEAVKTQARSEARFAREAVTRNEGIVIATREAADSAREALRITEVAYKVGATTNVEVVQAQQTARNAEVQLALAEDRLRQARLDLLVALGQFPR